ncbi:3-ketoacyl-ACP reductase [Planctomycetaceae bacterium SCGC AG-212-F19]|nr:3-ketoacyl-ACP reductase [Planctomycetaceae bacterium SCGC AG-212-F19]
MTTARKIALVTGSATGVGRAVALQFAKQGLAVAVNYSRSEADAQETLAEVKKLGMPGILCKANVADDRAVRAMVGRCKDELGGLDVLVNNAATTQFIGHTDLEALTDTLWDDLFGVNLKGAFYASRAAMPLLRERGGCIVNVSSVAGLSGDGSSIPYAASKAAMNSLTKSLARAFGPQVRVNAVAPGPILTRWLEGHMDRVEKYVTTAPMRRAATPDDIADVVVFLALGTSLMTGQVVVVDGGRTM